jgi:hypothetical protein
VFGEPDGRRWSPRAGLADGGRRDALLAAMAYFEGESSPPPPELEATQRDVAELLRAMLRGEPGKDDPARRALQEALDAVDDGLPADAVLDSLQRAVGAPTPRSALDAISELYLRRAG